MEVDGPTIQAETAAKLGYITAAVMGGGSKTKDIPPVAMSGTYAASSKGREQVAKMARAESEAMLKPPITGIGHRKV